MELRTAGDMLDLVRSLDLESVAIETMENTTEELIRLNKEQLLHGKTSDGDLLAPYRSEDYANYKHGLNPLPGFGTPDYRLTGAFFSGFVVTISGDVEDIHSTDPKTQKLEDREGGGQIGADRIFGPDDESHEEYVINAFAPEFYEILYRALKMI